MTRRHGPPPKEWSAEALLHRCVPEPNTGCFLWTGRTSDKGYARLLRSGRVISVHRLIWTLLNGPIPGGFCVLHKCDVPQCINPRHLFLGTVSDNSWDMAQKGRGRRGRLAYGVHRIANTRGPNRFSAQVGYLGKVFHLGSYPSEQEAHEVAQQFKRALYLDPGGRWMVRRRDLDSYLRGDLLRRNPPSFCGGTPESKPEWLERAMP